MAFEGTSVIPQGLICVRNLVKGFWSDLCQQTDREA